MTEKTLVCIDHGVLGLFDEIGSEFAIKLHREEGCDAPIERVDLLPIELEMAELLERSRPNKVS